MKCRARPCGRARRRSRGPLTARFEDRIHERRIQSAGTPQSHRAGGIERRLSGEGEPRGRPGIELRGDIGNVAAKAHGAMSVHRGQPLSGRIGEPQTLDLERCLSLRCRATSLKVDIGLERASCRNTRHECVGECRVEVMNGQTTIEPGKRDVQPPPIPPPRQSCQRRLFNPTGTPPQLKICTLASAAGT